MSICIYLRTVFLHTWVILYFYLCKIRWVAIVGGLWRGIHGGFHKAVGLRVPGWQYLLLCFALFFAVFVTLFMFAKQLFPHATIHCSKHSKAQLTLDLKQSVFAIFGSTLFFTIPLILICCNPYFIVSPNPKPIFKLSYVK